MTLRQAALGALIAAPMLLNAVALWPEVAIPTPNVNDDAEHIAFVLRASDALANGENLIDHWLPEIDLGFPEFFYYQHVPHLAVVALHRALFGTVDLFVLFNFVRWVLLVTLPLTVFWTMRRLGLGDIAAAIGAASASLLSGDHRYGFEYDSYVWRGFGLYTQIWAMHLSFIALACLHRLLRTGRGIVRTIVVLTILALSHLIYAYMMAITALVILVFTLRRGRLRAPLVQLAVAGSAVLAISAYLWVPFVTQTAYLSTSPYLQPEKFASYGAPAVLGWFASGELLDHGRLPLFTALCFAGVAAAVARRQRVDLLILAVLAVWLWFYSGREAIGPLFALLPLHDGLLFHRFIGGVDLAAILLIGMGGAAICGVVERFAPRILDRTPHWRIPAAAAAAVLLLLPAGTERWNYYRLQASWLTQTHAAIDADADLRTILGTLQRLPAGRVYAGLASNWGRRLDFGLPFNSVHVSQLLTAEGFATVSPPFGGQSLNADLQFDFDDQRASQYDLYDARYVIAGPEVDLPSFLDRLAVTPRYVLYAAPTSGYAEMVSLSAVESFRSQSTLFPRMRAFVTGPEADRHEYARFDFPAPADGSTPKRVPACPSGGTVANEQVGPARLSWSMSCEAATPVVVKLTYHPNWVVTIDDAPVTTFMASPSYLGFTLPPGRHAVVAEYRSAPLKGPLLGLGGLTVLALVSLRGRTVFGRR